GGVGDGASERTDLVETAREREESVTGNAPVGRLEPDDPAESGRLADGPAGVGSEGERRLACRDDRGRAAARSAGHGIEIPWIVGRAVGRILGRGAHRELIGVGLAEEDRPGLTQLPDNRRVVGADVVLYHL